MIESVEETSPHQYFQRCKAYQSIRYIIYENTTYEKSNLRVNIWKTKKHSNVEMNMLLLFSVQTNGWYSVFRIEEKN